MEVTEMMEQTIDPPDHTTRMQRLPIVHPVRRRPILPGGKPVVEQPTRWLQALRLELPKSIVSNCPRYPIIWALNNILLAIPGQRPKNFPVPMGPGESTSKLSWISP